jgi:hypothetical protein
MGLVVGGGASIVRPESVISLMKETTLLSLDNVDVGVGTGKGIGTG